MIPWDDVFTSISKHIRGHILSIIEDYHEHWNNFGSERAKQLFVENYERKAGSLKKLKEKMKNSRDKSNDTEISNHDQQKGNLSHHNNN